MENENPVDHVNQQLELLKSDLQIVCFNSQVKFEKWLELNQINTKGIWVRFFKKNLVSPPLHTMKHLMLLYVMAG